MNLFVFYVIVGFIKWIDIQHELKARYEKKFGVGLEPWAYALSFTVTVAFWFPYLVERTFKKKKENT